MSIETLIAAAGPQIKEVVVEFGGVTQTVNVRQLKFREAGALNASLIGLDGKVAPEKIPGYREGLLATSICDDAGKSLYTADQIGDWPVLLVDAIEAAVRKANGLVDDAGEAAQKN